MVRRARWPAIALAVSAAALLGCPSANADASAAQRLVRAYSPILYLRAQDEHPPCDTSAEQFDPTSVGTVLGNRRVTLVREGPRRTRTITSAPTAADIAGRGSDYYLNLPGDPLDAGCTYAKHFAAMKRAGQAPAITYTHIAREKGQSGLVVEYWFYYYFNQFNDLHESDWEGMQVAFDANTPAKALAAGPTEIALYQHAGGEKASWTDDKVQKRGTHPIVYPAAGSHATFYDSAVYVENGDNGSGVGCDNTSAPLRRLTVQPRLVPSRPAPGSRFQWLTYDGHWGQKEKGFNNGPTGPYKKPQWRHPFTWMEGIRSASPTLPGGSVLGPAATGVFCGAVAVASEFINLQARSTLGVMLLALIAALAVLVPIVVTRWRPVDLSHLRRPRAFGQLIRTARQLYGHHWRTFVPIGLTAIPIVAAIEGVALLYRLISGAREINPTIAIGDFRLDLSLSISGIGRPLGFAVVAAAVISVVYLLDRGQPAGIVAAYRRTFGRFWRVVLGQLLAGVLLIALMFTVIGIPVAIWKYVEWQFVQQEILFEDKTIRNAFRGSTQLVRGNWWRTVRVAGFLWLLSVAAGPVLGFFLIFGNLSLVWVNVISSVVFALLVPYVAIGRTLLYLDLAARKEGQTVATAPRLRLPFRTRRPTLQPR